MGKAIAEDRQRSAAIYAALQQPGATLASVGRTFDICGSRVAQIAKRERDRRARKVLRQHLETLVSG
jgi:hypothetical protein